MGRNKANSALVVAANGRSVKEKHHRAARDNVAVPRNLVAIPEKNIKSKHQSYFQFFENKDRKEKKLEFQVTTDTTPPPGFEFVPSGNPELTQACKELSREQDAMIFIVSAAKDAHNNDEDDVKKLALQVHRMGHHIRRTIVEQAKAQVGRDVVSSTGDNWQLPDTQEEINRQAEAAMRDLFPRIPNFDKQMIIEHSFRKGKDYGKPKVGTSDLPLHRRVQLAVLAHIRHTHTRYDELLKEADWHIARKVVERTCLDILVKWRGDEETGRDQLDDILREVVVISDNSDDSDDSDDDEQESSDDDSVQEAVASSAVSTLAGTLQDMTTYQMLQHEQNSQRKTKALRRRISKQSRAGTAHSTQQKVSKRNKRGFKRYEAVQKRWEDAVNRNRHAQNEATTSYTPLERASSQHATQRPSVEIMSPVRRVEPAWENRTYLSSQPLRGEGQPHGYRSGQEESPTSNYPKEDTLVSGPNRPRLDLAPSEGVVIGRRIARLPIHPRNASVPERLPHGELKDFLVPSIEPISPHSRQDTQPSAGRAIREEQMRMEQVPIGQAGVAGRHPVHSNVRPMASEFQHHPPASHGFRPVMAMTPRERFVPPPYGPRYDPELRPHSTVGVSQELSRMYRLREPVEVARDTYDAPMPTSTRVIRVREEARPRELLDTEPARMREMSPHHFRSYRRASPLPAYGSAEHRRVVGEANDPRFDAPHRDPAISSARPLYYEVRPTTQPEWRQAPPFLPPEQISRANPQGPQVPHEVLVRRPAQDAIPVHRVSAGFQQNGYPHHDRVLSDHFTPMAAPAESGNVQYIYEQQAPSRDVVILR